MDLLNLIWSMYKKNLNFFEKERFLYMRLSFLQNSEITPVNFFNTNGISTFT